MSLSQYLQMEFDLSVSTTGTGTEGRRTLMRMGVTAAVIALAAAIGVFAVFQFTDAERERELVRWQQRLGIVADSRLADVESWVAAQKAVTEELAENGSLQLYLSVLSEGDDASAADTAEASYLRNLVSVVAQRERFAPAVSSTPIAANVEQMGVAGIALLGADGRGRRIQ